MTLTVWIIYYLEVYITINYLFNVENNVREDTSNISVVIYGEVFVAGIKVLGYPTQYYIQDSIKKISK